MVVVVMGGRGLLVGGGCWGGVCFVFVVIAEGLMLVGRGGLEVSGGEDVEVDGVA